MKATFGKLAVSLILLLTIVLSLYSGIAARTSPPVLASGRTGTSEPKTKGTREKSSTSTTVSSSNPCGELFPCASSTTTVSGSIWANWWYYTIVAGVAVAVVVILLLRRTGRGTREATSVSIPGLLGESPPLHDTKLYSSMQDVSIKGTPGSSSGDQGKYKTYDKKYDDKDRIVSFYYTDSQGKSYFVSNISYDATGKVIAPNQPDIMNLVALIQALNG